MTTNVPQLRQAILLTIIAVLLLAAAPFSVVAQSPGDLDTTFVGGVGGENSGASDVLIQPDGKHLITVGQTGVGQGPLGSINGRGRRYIARLNPDGSVDETFDTGAGFDSDIYAMALQPDGKIVVGGSFGTFTNESGLNTRSRIARLNANGTLDTTFLPAGGGVDSLVRAIVIRPDGKIFIAGQFSSAHGIPRRGVALLNADGSLDPTFSPTTGIGPSIPFYSPYVQAMELQPDGKIVIGGVFQGFNDSPSHNIARINIDGTIDPTFNVGSGAAAGSAVSTIAIQPDEKILIGGNFVTYNGVTAVGVVRINTDGSYDPSFLEGGTLATGHRNVQGTATDISVLPDGRIYITSTGFSTAFLGYSGYFSGFNSDGTLVFTAAPRSYPGAAPKHAIQGDGKIVTNIFRSLAPTSFGTNILRFHTNGSPDVSYNPILLTTGAVFDSVLQPDGKLLAVGAFSTANSTILSHIARFNPDGSYDATFAAARAGNYVFKVLLQPDGKILIAGIFSTVNTINRGAIARLNADGTLDSTFNTQVGANSSIVALAVQADGKILVGGGLTTFNGTPIGNFARLNPDGSLDPTFASGTGFNASPYGVQSIEVLQDGKISVAGDFSSYNGTVRNRLARLNSDGSLDTTFAPGTGANSVIQVAKVLPNGKLMLAGFFTGYNGIPRNRIVRLNVDGSVDPSFSNAAQPDFNVNELYVQSDGKTIIGGMFSNIAGQARRGIARLNADGSLDTGFGANSRGAEPMTGWANYFETGLAVDEAGGKLYYGGRFTTFNNAGRSSIARLFLNAPTVPAGTNVVYEAGDVQVTFDEVSQAGNISVTPIDPTSTGLTIPDGYTIPSDISGYDISTDAVTAPESFIEVCFSLSRVIPLIRFERFRMLHGEGANLVDRTSFIDFSTGRICSRTTGLSPFVIAEFGSSDTSSPTSQAVPSALPNASGWNNSNLNVSLSAVDEVDGSGVKAITYSAVGAQTIASTTFTGSELNLAITAEGETTISYFAADEAGNIEPAKTITIKLDKSAPAIGCDAADGSWHAADVSLACTATENVSSLASGAEANFTLSTSVAPGTETSDAATESRQICDVADNCATAGPVGGIKVDKKAPTITVIAPVAGNYLVNQAVTVNYTCTDGGSGASDCTGTTLNGGQLDTSSVGAKNFTVTSSDTVGNTAAPTNVNYNVNFGIQILFDQTKAHKAGSAVPIKIRLVDANGANVSNASTVVHALNVIQTSSQATTTLDDAGNSNPDFDFRYDGATGTYLFNLKTNGYRTGTYILNFVAGNSSTIYSVEFQVRK